MHVQSNPHSAATAAGEASTTRVAPARVAPSLSVLDAVLDGRDNLLRRARSIQPILSANADASEARGMLTDPVLSALADTGLFAAWIPSALGGPEAGPVDSVLVIEALAYADPSAAWVTMAIDLASGAAGAFLGDEAVAELFSGGGYPLIAGQGTRPGSAEPVEGGYLLSGSWSFGSGLLHSGYIHTLGKVSGGDETRIFIVPVDKAELDLDSWDVMGLRATGSVDYTLDSVFVPSGFTYVNTTRQPLRGGALYRLGIQQFALIGHTGWALGLARRMLDELAGLTSSKAGRMGRGPHSDAFESSYALAEARLRSARALALEAWTDLWEAVQEDEPVPTRLETMIRLALYNATWSAQSVSEFVYKTAGTTALRSGVIQRFFRDMHAGTQHVTSSEQVVVGCGRELVGLDPSSAWKGFALVPAT